MLLAYKVWEGTNPVMTWPAPEWEGKDDHKAHIRKDTECRPNEQLWQRSQIKHTPLIPPVPAEWDGTSQGRNGAERGLILSPEPEPDLREEDLPMADPPWLGPLVD